MPPRVFGVRSLRVVAGGRRRKRSLRKGIPRAEGVFPNGVEEETGGNAFLMATSNNTLQPVTQFWKEFDLETRRPQYDTCGLKIMENQEQSVQRRRQLAESTQSFRRSAESNVVSAVGKLLKQYQEEIDWFDLFSCMCDLSRHWTVV